MFISLHLSGIGSSAGLSGAVNGVSKSFSSKKRGSAMATTVAAFGLSAFFYSSLSHTITSADPTSSFLFLLTIGTTISMVLGAIFVRPVLHLPPAASRAGYLAVDNLTPSSRCGSPSPPSAAEESYFAEEEVQQDEARRRELSKERAAESLDINGRELLTHSDFWLMFTYLGLCSGVGLMCEFPVAPKPTSLTRFSFADLNNLGTITVTLALNEMDPSAVLKAQSHLVSLLSICNCLGRLGSGFASDYCTYHCPAGLRFARIWWFGELISVFPSHLAHSRLSNSAHCLAFRPLSAARQHGHLDRRMAGAHPADSAAWHRLRLVVRHLASRLPGALRPRLVRNEQRALDPRSLHLG